MQIKADVLQTSYHSLIRSDLSTLGSALLAGFAVGMFSGAEEVTGRFLKVSRRIEPRPAEGPKYTKSIEVYAELFHALKGVLPQAGIMNARDTFLGTMPFEKGPSLKAEFGYWTTTIKRFLREGMPMVSKYV